MNIFLTSLVERRRSSAFLQRYFQYAVRLFSW